ncbi:hypothetical protein J3F83DRAFT_754568 [Trichoderma novae-zelandiae]
MASNANSMDSTGTTSHPTSPPTPSSETVVVNPSTTTASIITEPPPSYRSQCPVCNPLDPTLTNIHTNGTIVLPYDNAAYQREPRPNVLKESLIACVEYCCLPRPPPSDWSSDYSTTPYPSSLSSYTDPYSRMESRRSLDRISEAEPVQTENVSKQNVAYAKQEGMRSAKGAGSEPSSQHCCRHC